MESEIVAAASILLSVLSIAGLLFATAKLRSLPANDSVAQLAERLDSIARDLDEKFTQTRTDLAGRLQQAQGDLDLATADRLSQGSRNLNAALDSISPRPPGAGQFAQARDRRADDADPRQHRGHRR